MDNLTRFVSLPILGWIIATAVLFIMDTQSLVPQDAEQILERTTEFSPPDERSQTLDLTPDQPQGEVEVTYVACVGEENDRARSQQRYFDPNNCAKILEDGGGLWVRILIENRSPRTLSDFAVSDEFRGDIPLDAACWLSDLPTRAIPNPEPGWGGDEPGVLTSGEQDENRAVCIYFHEVGENAEDPLLSELTINFNIEGGDIPTIPNPAAETAEIGDDVPAEIPITDQLPVNLTTYARVNTAVSLGPTLWVTSLGTDASRVIDIGTHDTGIALYWLTLAFVVIELVLAYMLRDSNDKLIRPMVRVVGVFLIFWSFFGHEIFWDALLAELFPTAVADEGDIELLYPAESVIAFAAEHLELVIVSSLITVPLGLAIGIFVTREAYREFLPLITNIVNLGQTIPTLAVVAVMAPIIGLGFTPAIIALILYGLLPTVRNTIAGLEGVPPAMIDAARGMGMTPLQILIQIEIPIASSIIMAGVRTTMVINVGTAALGAYVIAGGLGEPIANGLLRAIDPWVLLGAIPAALLAVLIDYILGRIEYVLTPRGLQITQ